MPCDEQMLQRSLRFSFAFSHCFWTLVLAWAPTSYLPCAFPPQYAVLVTGCLALAGRLVQWLAPWSLSPSARVLSTKLDQVLCILCRFQERSWFWSRKKGQFCIVDPCWSTPIVIAQYFVLLQSFRDFLSTILANQKTYIKLLWANPIRHFMQVHWVFQEYFGFNASYACSVRLFQQHISSMTGSMSPWTAAASATSQARLKRHGRCW